MKNNWINVFEALPTKKAFKECLCFCHIKPSETTAEDFMVIKARFTGDVFCPENATDFDYVEFITHWQFIEYPL